MKDIAEFIQNLHTYHGIRGNGLPRDVALGVGALGIDQDICVKTCSSGIGFLSVKYIIVWNRQRIFPKVSQILGNFSTLDCLYLFSGFRLAIVLYNSNMLRFGRYDF